MSNLKNACALVAALIAAFPAPTQENDKQPRKFELVAESPAFWNLIDRDAQLTSVASGFGFTEGPVWDRAGFLYVSDETQNKIYRVYLNGQKQTVISLGDPDGNTFDEQQRLIDCASVLRAIIRVSPDGQYTTLADRFEGKRFNSPNDIVMGPDGALYFTDPTLDLLKGEKQEIPFQGVYRLGPNGDVRLLVKDMSQPNGLGFSPDGKRLYVDDSDRKDIRVFDFNNGAVGNQHLFGEEKQPGGVPDGMRLDEAGNIFVTGPKGIWIWDPQGHHLGTIIVPEQPANLAWGGSDYQTLYITATTSVYRIRTKTRGFIPYLKAPRSTMGADFRPPDEQKTATIRVHANRDHVVNSFDPDRALGTSLDVQPYGVIDKIFTQQMLKEMLSTGWGPITYRNNTELRISAWHWNENGVWSDPVHKSGYWVSSSEPADPIRYISSYSLPHRGFSQSADGASSLMSGGSLSYWKSNPYLTSRFTGEPDSKHPQWVVIDLGAPQQINGIRIAWENPFARAYHVDYWIGSDALERIPEGRWETFPRGNVTDAKGGTVTLRLSEQPISSSYVRIWMTESSGTCDIHGSEDARNCVGYAISEIAPGTFDGDRFTAIPVKPSGSDRTAIYTSSVDPWHSASDVAQRGAQHTGFDLFFTSGITNNHPAMIPVTLLYGNPEDSAAQMAYLKRRGYQIGWVEMGEEPDGKHMLPEDYGALYLQWASAIHKVDPDLKLGGPVFEGMNEDLKVWPDAQGRTSWMGRFIEYLRSHDRLSDLAFASFEHYPFDPCTISWNDLYREPQLTSHILQVWREDGVPRDTALMITESNLSWNLTGPMSQIFSALWLADSVGSFLDSGGAEYYHSPIQPEPVRETCLGSATWGNFVPDANLNIKAYTAQYFAGRLINLEWAQHRAGVHQMFAASCEAKDAGGNALITAYALHRPDGQWSLMLINKDHDRSHRVRVEFDQSAGRQSSFAGPVTMVTFGREQYIWHENGRDSLPDPDGPPVSKQVQGGPNATFVLPKASVTVLRGNVESLDMQTDSRSSH